MSTPSISKSSARQLIFSTEWMINDPSSNGDSEFYNAEARRRGGRIRSAGALACVSRLVDAAEGGCAPTRVVRLLQIS